MQQMVQSASERATKISSPASQTEKPTARLSRYTAAKQLAAIHHINSFSAGKEKG